MEWNFINYFGKQGGWIHVTQQRVLQAFEVWSPFPLPATRHSNYNPEIWRPILSIDVLTCKGTPFVRALRTNELQRHTTPETYTFVPADGGDRGLSVNRLSGEIQVSCEIFLASDWLLANSEWLSAKFQTGINNLKSKSSDVFGIIGIISLTISESSPFSVKGVYAELC